MTPEELYYTKTHEWVRVEGEIATVGITDYAQSELGDIVFIELPEVGRVVSAGEAFATIEAVKTVADVYAPVSGEIVEVNETLRTSPDVANKSPYDEGWIVKIRMSKPDEVKSLLSAEDYKAMIGEV